MSPRRWTPWESSMVGEWARATFGDVKVQTNVRLGRVQPRASDGRYSEDELALLGVWRRFVDAIVYLPDRLLIVEATMRADPGKLAQLELYESLLNQTPELEPYRQLPKQLVLLYCIEDPAVNVLAERKGVLALRFVPSFFDEWWSKLRGRDQRAPVSPF